MKKLLTFFAMFMAISSGVVAKDYKSVDRFAASELGNECRSSFESDKKTCLSKCEEQFKEDQFGFKGVCRMNCIKKFDEYKDRCPS